ncbi:MAG: acetolactate decarboxylase [Minisyncoccia bacterium]|jgi:acetolactate decarboxylase
MILEMHDPVLSALRNSIHQRTRHGEVDQTRSAGRLFAGDFSSGTTAGAEFGSSRLGIGVMHDLDGEIVSLRGETWRIPVDGKPVAVGPNETIAFGIAAHGGRRHALDVPDGSDVDGIVAAIDSYLKRTHTDHEQVVCAVEIVGEFSDVLARTVAPPDHQGVSLGEVIDRETRFNFSHWQGTMVGFRFPNHTNGDTIPGLHLHAISIDRSSGGHVRNVVTRTTHSNIWIDELHPIIDNERVDAASDIDFSRYEGPSG